MAQGIVSKENAQTALDALNEVFEAIPKTRRLNYLGHLNEIALLLEAVKRQAPTEAELEQEQKPT